MCQRQVTGFKKVTYFRDSIDDPIGLDENAPNEQIFYNSRSLSSYDFIVVGGGTAGCIIASRLSEDPDVNVLLLEAGGDGNLASMIPMMQSLTLYSEIDWAYKTEKDGKTCQGLKDKRCVYNRGKAIGGTSLLNAMVYIRGMANWFNIA